MPPKRTIREECSDEVCFFRSDFCDDVLGVSSFMPWLYSHFRTLCPEPPELFSRLLLLLIFFFLFLVFVILLLVLLAFVVQLQCAWQGEVCVDLFDVDVF
jgi:hypothetical protein